MDDFTATLTPLLIERGSTMPFAKEVVVLTKQEHIELTWQINHFKTLHKRALGREVELKKQLAQEKAKVRDLTQRLYGKKTEKTKKNEKDNPDERQTSTRPRGQQKGAKGHGRTQRPGLSVVIETRDLADNEKQCVTCRLPYAELSNTEDSEIIEVSVSAYTRKIKRKKYTSQCHCNGAKGIITASPAPRVLNRNNVGVSVWVEILLDKYHYSQATNRRLSDFASLGCPLSQGTVTGGLQRFAPLFQPLIEAFRIKQLTERLFHADETGWKVFEKLEGKEGYRWYLWLMQSPSVAYYLMAPGRDAGVPTDHFNGLEEGKFTVFLVCDRYSAYGKLVKNIPLIVLAFCWAHVRRDFLDAARRWPELKDWMFHWLDDIAELYHLNNVRVSDWDKDNTLSKQSKVFKQSHTALRKKIAMMKAKCDTCLRQKDLDEVQRSILTSLENHWSGLILFAQYPQIRMDNNLAERGLRNPVTGRKRYYGSGSVWSAKLAAMMFTVLQTLPLWDINPRHWLTVYLTACAENGGKAPSDLSVFLPWEMTEERLHKFMHPTPMTGMDTIGLPQDSG